MVSKISNTVELRRVLIQELVNVTEGKANLVRIRAVCTLSQQIYNTAKLELQSAALIGATSISAYDFERS